MSQDAILEMLISQDQKDIAEKAITKINQLRQTGKLNVPLRMVRELTIEDLEKVIKPRLKNYPKKLAGVLEKRKAQEWLRETFKEIRERLIRQGEANT